MPKIPLAQLLAELGAVTDRDERMEYLIELSEQFEEVPERVARRPFPETALVPACQSEAYAFAEPQPDGSLRYYFAVENPQGISAKAMGTIIEQTLSGAPLDDVIGTSTDMVYDIFGKDIGMGKGQGLRSMLLMVQALARQEKNRRSDVKQ